MRKALVSFGVYGHERYLDVSRPLFEAYADQHGYDLLTPDNILDDRPPSWQKVRALKYYLHDYDFLLWLDCDVVIVDGSQDIADEIDQRSMQAVVQHYTKDGTVPNFGVWALQKHAHVFEWLELLWAQEQHTQAPWWEQTAALELMGYKSTQRPCALWKPNEWYYYTQFINIKWNSHPWCKATMPMFEHVTMYDNRLETMQALASKAKWHKQQQSK